MKRAMRLLCASVFYAAAGGVLAATSNVQFSAQAQQSTPDKKTRNAQIYVGNNRVRLEYRQDERNMIEIYDIENQRALLLVPQQAVYIEQNIPPGGMKNPLLPPVESSPCSFAKESECTRLGNETLYGRPVVKWEMTSRRDEQVFHSMHWIDEQRQMPLRQFWEDGTVSEMRPMGQQLLHGRNTERWQLVVTRDGVESVQSSQWYDPELKIVIREELPGGYFRELSNIQLAEQPEQLFQVPDGYRQMEITPPKLAPAAGGQRQPAPAPQAQPRQ